MSSLLIAGGAIQRRKNSAKPNGGVQNEVCRFTPMSDAEPDQIDAHSPRDTGSEKRNGDEGDLETVEEERQEEDDKH